jgi:hypothetical protein
MRRFPKLDLISGILRTTTLKANILILNFFINKEIENKEK